MSWDVLTSFLQILQVLSSSRGANKLTFPMLQFSKVIWALFWVISLVKSEAMNLDIIQPSAIILELGRQA